MTMQEVFGPRSSHEAFLRCMVKTRQWQDTMFLDPTDSRPCAAYYRTLGYLDAGLSTLRQNGGVQQKVMEWVDECLQYEQLAVANPDVLSKLTQIRQHWRFPHEDGLHTWQDSFLDEPLHYQWMTSEEVVQADGRDPFKCGHNQGSLTRQPAADDNTAYQQPAQGTTTDAAMMQQLQQQSYGDMQTHALLTTEPSPFHEANPALDIAGLSQLGLPPLNICDGSFSANQHAHQEHAANMPAWFPAGVQSGPDLHAQPMLNLQVQPVAGNAGFGAPLQGGVFSADNMVSSGWMSHQVVVFGRVKIACFLPCMSF